MNLIVSLSESEEAKLFAKAQAEGTTPEGLVRRAIQPILDSTQDAPAAIRKPKKSSLGALAHLGEAPSAEDISAMRKEAFKSLGR